jgi:predicted house-cleaning noncanonical NTP pyrophosphatase (MazG superfamily)
MKYNKLVRDKIPEIITKRGGVPVTRIAADDKEYWSKLKEKLAEEVEEFAQTEGWEEMADILEVMDAILDHMKIDKAKVMEIKAKKLEERGGFKDRIILEES